jgi:hypothetical protein
VAALGSSDMLVSSENDEHSPTNEVEDATSEHEENCGLLVPKLKKEKKEEKKEKKAKEKNQKQANIMNKMAIGTNTSNSRKE